MISVIENEASLPSLETLDKLEELFNIDIPSFLHVENDFYKKDNVKVSSAKTKKIKKYYYFLIASIFFLLLIFSLLLIAFLNPLYINYALSYKWWFIYFFNITTIVFNIFLYIFIVLFILFLALFFKGLIYDKKEIYKK